MTFVCAYLHVEVEGIRVVVVALDRTDDLFYRILGRRREVFATCADLNMQKTDSGKRKGERDAHYTSYAIFVSGSDQNTEHAENAVVTPS